LPSQEEKAAERVAEASKKALEAAALKALEAVMNFLAEWVATTMLLDDRVLDKLAEWGVEDPSPRDALRAVEEVYGDSVDIEEAYRHLPEKLRVVVDAAISLARRIAKREWIEKMTYENVLALAEKRGLEKLRETMQLCPRLSRKVIEWLKSRVSG
jgi:KaiC/GvpD/RAD55 family RecA-like ATPase